MNRNLRVAIFVYSMIFGCVILWLISATGHRMSTPSEIKRITFQRIRWQPGITEQVQTTTYKELRANSYCNGTFIGYGQTFAKLLNVVIDPSKGKGRRGGENCSEVFNQAEEDEYFTLYSGYFKLLCPNKKKYEFKRKSHLNHWQDILETKASLPNVSAVHSQWTIAIIRYEYANLYHTMTDFYNAFVVANQFKMQPGNISVLWIDGHPTGALDETWTTLFGNVIRAGDINKPLMFSHMVWGIMGYDSYLNNHNKLVVPHLEEFRTFFLSQHGVDTKSDLNCSKLKIMFLWRRDYLAHPRNPSGSVSRKIKNEDELLAAANKTFPEHRVVGLQIDKLSMPKQLEIIAGVDILVGMHGAGLSHTLFLPKHAGLVELYPTYWSNANKHFMAMARWRGLSYQSWVNRDRSKELPNHYTVVDVNKVIDLMAKTKRKICN